MAEDKAVQPKLLLFTYGTLGVVTQIEFPEKFRGNDGGEVKVERSCEGALHLRPGTVFLTESEKAYLDKQHPGVARHLLFVAEHESTEAKTARLAAASAAVHNAPPPSNTPPSSGGPPDAGGSGGGEASETSPKPKTGKGSKGSGSGE